MNPAEESFVDFVNVDNNEQNEADRNDNLNLLPDECFTVDNNPDSSKKFTCKQCSRDFKSERSVRQHIGAMHKALKRTASKTENFSRKFHKKAVHLDDLEDVEHSTQAETVNSTTAFCKDFLGNGGFVDESFSLDMSIEKLVKDKNPFHSTAISDDDDDYLTPDQDHNKHLKNDDEDVTMLKAKLVSMELELIIKDTTINEKVNEMNLAKVEIDELNIKVYEMKKEKEDKDEAFDIATGKISSLEDDKQNLQEKLRMYSATIKRFRTQMNVGSSSKDNPDRSDTEKELRQTLKEKNKKLAEGDARSRKLAEKLSELEANKEENATSVDGKYKKVNDKLTAKSKDLKNVEQKLKQSEARVKDLIESMNDKNKKLSELENANNRLRLMKDQAFEMSEKARKASVGEEKVNKSVEKEDNADKFKNKTEKCRYENTGVCRRKTECHDVHPKKTCQPHSKLGSCPLESTCEHRHPFGICYDWEKFGSCYDGDNCRHRHPFDVVRAAATATPDHFLGYGAPGGSGGPAQAVHWSPGRAHHDQRGNRW